MLLVPACDSGPRRPDVIVLLIDTLRASQLGVYGYPRDVSRTIDTFANRNLRFEYAIAPAPWTPPSVASMFTGYYPTAHGVHTHLYDEDRATQEAAPVLGEVLSEDFETLAEVFQSHGYRTHAVTTNAWIKEELGFAQGFESFEVYDYHPAQHVNQRAFALLEELTPDNDPWFLFLHYMDPHEPYQPPPGYAGKYRGTPPGVAKNAKHGEWINRYDEEIRYVDAQIAALFAHLRQIERYEDTIVLLVGDHGEQFFERGQHGHGFRLHNEEVHVPLILKAPGLEGTVPETVSLVDVYPTLLGLAGIEAPGSQGVSLVTALDQRKAEGVLSEMTRWRNEKAFIDAEGRKLVLEFEARDTDLVGPESQTGVRLFDRNQDYRELSSLEGDRAKQELTRRFYELYGTSLEKRGQVATEQVELDPETLEQLRMLGYLDGE